MSRGAMAVAFVTWERHRRTRELANAFDAHLMEVVSASRGLKRYPGLAARTIIALRRTRPTHLLVQCPSVILAVLTVILRPFMGYRLILDLHNESVEPFVNTSRFYGWLLAFLHRSADMCLVTTSPLREIVHANGGRAYVLPDRVPRMSGDGRPGKDDVAHVVFVCSFAPDEPVGEVIDAARLLDHRTVVHVTGRAPESIRQMSLPSNVRLTGFLPEAEYERLLQDATVIVDLTAMENCLVCGAYEAVALRKPLVTSDTAALRSYFRRGTVYTRHDAAAIASAIRRAIEDAIDLGAAMHLLQQELDAQWGLSLDAIVSSLRLPQGARANTPVGGSELSVSERT